MSRKLEKYFNMEKQSITYIALVFALFSTCWYMTLLKPEVARLYFPAKSCHISQSIITTRYCCETICNGCYEGFPPITNCASLITDQYKYKNASMCPIDKTFCAEEGKYCDNGYYCCDKGRQYDDDWGCDLPVNHRVCTLHCPECYKTRITYRYDDVFVPREKDFLKNKISAELYLAQNPEGKKRDCWINPKDTHDIHFTKSLTWWKVLVGILLCIPFLSLVGLVMYNGYEEYEEYENAVIRPQEERRLIDRGSPPPGYSVT